MANCPPESATAEHQLARIRAAKKELEREARERAEQAAREKTAQNGKARDEAQRNSWLRARPAPDPQTKANLTDPDSRLMVDRATKAYLQGHNTQAALDGEARSIVACGVTQQLTPPLESVGKDLGARVSWH